MWFQVFLSNSNNFQTDLFDFMMSDTTSSNQSGPESYENERVTPYSPELEPQRWMQFCVIPGPPHTHTFGGFYTSAGNAVGVL